MLEIKDEHSESWVELTEYQYYYGDKNETDYAEAAGDAGAFPSESEQSVQFKSEPEQAGSNQWFKFEESTSEFENEYPLLTEGDTVRQRERGFDVRNFLNRNRFKFGESTSEFENEYPLLTEGDTVRQRERGFDVRNRLNRNRFKFGESTSEFENEYPLLTEGDTVRQRERDFDVRNRLNRNRGDYHGDNGQWRDDRRRGYRDNAPWQRDHSRESYDSNPYSYRPRNANRSADSSPFRSPLNREKRPGFRDFDNSSYFRFTSHGRGDGRSNYGNNGYRSCRRLYPSSQEDEDETNRRFEVVTDEDKAKLARREKDIAYGKNTDDYKKYVETVPKYRRMGDRKRHPRTPDKYVNCSRRSWDAQVRKWKLSLHAWAADNCQEVGPRGDCSQKSFWSEGIALKVESTSEKEENIILTLAEDNVEHLDVKVKAEIEEEETGGEKGEDEETGDEKGEGEDEGNEKGEGEHEGNDEEVESEEDEGKEGEDDNFLDAIDYSLLVSNQENV